LLELFAGHGQNRFYRELEEWLSTITKISFGASDGDNDSAGAGAYMGVLAEQIEAMQSLFTRSDIQRSLLDERLGELTTKLDVVADKLTTDGNPAGKEDGDLGQVLTRLADSQERLLSALQVLHDEGDSHPDAESRMRLRSIDVQLLRVLEEMQVGRQETLSDIRNDLALVTKSIKVASGQEKA
jgi:lysyl-tRNA synthetase class II